MTDLISVDFGARLCRLRAEKSANEPTSVRMGIPSDPSCNGIQSGSRAMAQERLGRVERRLAAILAADVAGYSKAHAS